jgi:hypothetical protein
MSAKKSQDASAQESTGDKDEMHEFQATGAGAASALERMKAEHALRHKRQHGSRTWGPGHEEDQTPER